MKVRITMEFTPEQVEAIVPINGDIRPEMAMFMVKAVDSAMPEVMKRYRQQQIVDLKEQIAELEADD